MTVLLVALGAGLGAPARYLTDMAVRARWPGAFPWGTLLVNLLGSLLAGAVLAGSRSGALPAEAAAGLVVGFCGALTTYSTFSWETLRLAEQRAYRAVVGNVVANAVGSVLAAAAGWGVVGALVSGPAG